MNKVYIYLVIMFLLMNCSSVPSRPDNVPVSVEWLGGVDGGVWINFISPESDNNVIYIDVYHEFTGEYFKRCICRMDAKCGEIEITSILGELDAFNGLKLHWKDNSKIKNCFQCRYENVSDSGKKE